MNLAFHLLPSVFVGVAALAAQAPLTARSFLPDDYKNGACVDLAAMRKQGIWDELDSSVLKLLLTQLEQRIGFPLRALDRATVVALPTEQDDAASRSAEVYVFEGNLPLAMPPSVRQQWPEVGIGGHPTRQRDEAGDLYVCPRPELLVCGSEAIVRPVLEGRPHQGLPAPDVMSMLSGRNDALAWLVVHTGQPRLRLRVLGRLFPGIEWPDGEAPEFLCLRLLAKGDPDDPHLGLELVMRHPHEGAGLDVSARAMAVAVETLLATPQLRPQQALLRRLQTKRDRADLVCSLDLGRVRDAVGQVAALGALFLVAEVTSVPQPALGAPAAPVPVPVPQPKK